MRYRFRRGHGLRTRTDRIARARALGVCTILLCMPRNIIKPMCSSSFYSVVWVPLLTSFIVTYPSSTMASVIDNVYGVPGISAIFSCNDHSSWLPALSSQPVDLSSRLDVAGINPLSLLNISVSLGWQSDHPFTNLGMFISLGNSFPVPNNCF